MSQLVVLRPSPKKGTLARFWDQVRSITLGPYSTKDPALARLFGNGSRNTTGVAVNEDSAFDYAAFWQGVGLIAGHIASFPLITYKRLQPSGKERYTRSKLYRLLHDEFNPFMDAYVGREIMTAHALSWGNAYAEIERDGFNQPVALWPLTPDRVTPEWENDQVIYRVANPIRGGVDTIIPARDMVHIRGLGYDGLCGWSVVRRARGSIGLGIAAERFGGAFFGNGSTFGGIISMPEVLDPEAEDALRASIEGFHQGPERAHRFMILHGGLTYQSLGVPPHDAEFLETRKFQVEEIARWLNLPPHKLKHLDRSTNNNIEHQGVEYYTDTLWPWQVRWEKELNRKLISPLERNAFFVEHLVDAVLKGDIESRYKAYAVGRQWGWLSADDIRERENMNPLPGGSGAMYLVPYNMVPADRIQEVIDKQVAPDAAPVMPSGGNRDAEIAILQQQIADLEQRHMAAVERSAKAETEMLVERSVTAEALATAETMRAEVVSLSSDLAAAKMAMQLLQEQAMREQQAREAAEGQMVLQARLEAVATAQAEAERVAREQAQAERDDATILKAEARREADIAITNAARAEADMEAARAEADRMIADAMTRVATVETEKAEAERAAKERAEMFEVADAARQGALAMFDKKAAEEQRARQEASALAKSELELQDQIRLLQTLVDDQKSSHASELAALKAAADAQAQETTVERTAREAAEARAATIEAETQAQRAANIARLTATIAAHRGLIVDALGRMVRRETEKARRHQATPAKLRSWAEAFYVTHEDTCVTALLPAITAHLAWNGSTENPTDAALAIVRDHIADSLRQLRAVVEGTDPDEFAVVLERTLHRWEQERPNALADRLLRQEIDYVRSL